MLLVTGASGLLGANILLEARDEERDVMGAFCTTPLRNAGLRAVGVDLRERGAAARLVHSVEPTCVINCVALANVDRCESHREDADALNHRCAKEIAEACAAAGIGMVQISTDSVFDGTRGQYTEQDAPAPVNTYARTKLQGERAVAEANPDALIVRTNFVAHSARAGVGFADWLAKKFRDGEQVTGFTDVVFSPLLANDLAQILFKMIDHRLSGIYHVGARDCCSKYDFAAAFAEALSCDPDLVKAGKLEDVSLTAPRPRDTSLVTTRVAEALGREMPPVSDSIEGLAALERSGYAGRLVTLTAA